MRSLRICLLSAFTATLAQGAFGDALQSSLYPPKRAVGKPASYVTKPPVRTQPQAGKTIELQKVASDGGLQDWLVDFKVRGGSAGIRADVMDSAFHGVTYDAKAIKRDRNQSEFTKTIWEYLGTAVSDLRIKNGKSALKKHMKTLKAVERKYGVEKEIVAAIWGLESAYGTFRGSDNVIRSLATLAYDGRRGAFFEEQLIAALMILQAGDTTPEKMTGSWAGAMGHTQFMPTSFLDHAVDHTGDGRRNIWGDDPRDALASTAAYLKFHGWMTGMPWGVEVSIPDRFDYLLANREILKSPQEWANLGVRGLSGAIKNHGPASVLLPAGGDGAAFLIFSNFEVLEQYNTADAYVIGVGHLADRIKGGPGIQSGWPYDDRALTYNERVDMQRRLTAKGFDTQKNRREDRATDHQRGARISGQGRVAARRLCITRIGQAVAPLGGRHTAQAFRPAAQHFNHCQQTNRDNHQQSRNSQNCRADLLAQAGKHLPRQCFLPS